MNLKFDRIITYCFCIIQIPLLRPFSPGDKNPPRPSTQPRHIPHILLHRNRRKEAEHERHGVEAFFAAGEFGVPQAYHQQHDGQAEAHPCEAEVKAGDWDAFQAVAHGLLQRDGGEQAVHQHSEVVALFVEQHLGVPQAE